MNERMIGATALQRLVGAFVLLVSVGMTSHWSVWAQDALDLPDDVVKAAAQAGKGKAKNDDADLEELEALLA
mgnify:FL=1